MYLALKNALGKSFILFSGLLNKFSGASAAYSFRNLNNAYGGPIVKVRRDIDQGATSEREFNSYEVNQIEDWVNGKQETTLPADSSFGGATAAYSLRKVNPSYIGSAARIRRASDNVEVNVGFDSQDEVSASSPITNVPEEFLSNDFTTWQSAGGANVTSSSSFTTSADAQGVQLSVPTGTKVKVTGAGTVTGAIVQLYDWSNGGNKQNLSGSFSFSTTFTIAGEQQKIYFRSAQATSINFTSLTIEVVNDDGGDTTATTLGAFLNEPIPTFTADFSSGVNGFLSYSSDTLAGNEDGIGGEDNNLSSTQSGTGQVVYGLNGRTTIGKKYKVSFKYYVPSGSGSYTQISIRDGAFTIIGSDESPTTNNWISVEATAVFTTPQIRFQFVGTSVVGEKIYIRDVVVSEIGEATVHTWYDQSGDANDATQDTSGSQPKIAETGSLLDDIDFSGDSFLQASSLQEQVPVSIFSVNRFDSTLSGFRPFIGNGILDSNSEGYGLLYNDPNNTFRSQVRIPSASTNLDNTASTSGNVKALTTAIINASTVTSFYNGGNETSVSNTQGAVTPNRTLTIGGSETGSPSSVTRFFNGGISEIIIYDSDQSANRFKIESNINNYYSIYTPAGDGFVNTWYDQSGHSNDAVAPADTNEPKIVSAGSLTTQGGKPCLDFDGVDDVMEFPQADVNTGNIRSVFVACSAPTSNNTSVMGTAGEFLIKKDSFRAISLNNLAQSRLDSAFSFSGTITHLVTVIRNFTAPSSSLSLDGDVDATRTDSYGLNSVHQIGGKKSGSNIIEEADFNCLEIIVYPSDQTTNRASIESNIADEYGINIS